MNTLYNGKVVIPKVFQPPKWYFETKEIYKKTITEDYKQKGYLDPNTVKKLIEDILEHKIKVSYPLNKKNISKLYTNMYNVFPDDIFLWKYQIIYEFGFFLSTFKPSSFSPESMMLPPEFAKEKDKIKNDFENSKKEDKDIINANKRLKDLAEKVMEYFRKNNISVVDLIDSGSKGSVDDIRKILLGVGASINAKGEVNDFILNSHADGLTKTQMFNYSSQAIVALYSKSSNTAKPGYLIRKLYTLMDNVELSKDKDCGTTKTFEFKIPAGDAGVTVISNLKGRYYKSSPTGDLKIITLGDTDNKNLLNKTIYLRSSLYCKSTDGICETCYGSTQVKELRLKPHDPIGKIAVNAFAESLVNITLKSSHTGLSLDLEEVDLTKDIKKHSK